MKKPEILYYALILTMLSACGSTRFSGINKVDDDVYWSRKDEPKTGVNYKDVEPWNKNKGPNMGNYEAYRAGMLEQALVNGPDSLEKAREEERANEAYKAWLQKRGMQTATDNNNNTSTNNSNVISSDKSADRDNRRVGEDQAYYYSDPYYNSLSRNWGWTSFYTPVVVRPGYYSWAPGFRIGLGWNNYTGFTVTAGYNTGWGGLSYGYNPYGYAYDPWFGYGAGYYSYYDPWYYGYSYYNPWYRYPYYGYGYYGYHSWYGNPYYHPWAYGYGCHNNYWRYNNRDVVYNRPISQPRNSMGSSVPAAGSRPGMPGTQMQSSSARPGMNDAVPTRNEQQAMSRPTAPVNQGSDAARPANPATTKPGGDLVYDPSGRPVYIPPSGQGRSEASATPQYSNRPGGELRPGNNGAQVYVPARPVQPAQSAPDYNRPASYDNNSGYSAPSRNSYSSPDNRSSAPAYRNESSGRSQPSYSAPSSPPANRSAAPAPAPSRSPAPAPSSGGGGGRSAAPSGGGSFRPR